MTKDSKTIVKTAQKKAWVKPQLRAEAIATETLSGFPTARPRGEDGTYNDS